MTSCYKCGARPHHPTKSLDVLKTIQCADCGCVACIKHRGGVLGTTCPKCGSSRSFIAAFRSGKKMKQNNSQAPMSGGASGVTAQTVEVGISTGTLKQMQENRSLAEKQAKDRLASLAAIAAKKQLSQAEKAAMKKAEEALAKLTGNKKLIMDPTASENYKPAKSKTLDKSPKAMKDFKSNKSQPKKLQGFDYSPIKSSLPGAQNISSDSSLSGVSAKLAVAVENKKPNNSTNKNNDNKQSNLLESTATSSLTQNSSKAYVSIIDNFCVKATERLDIIKGAERRKEAERQLANFIKDELKIAQEVVCTLKVNCLVPIDNIDHLLNLDAKELRKEKINLITGFLPKSFNYENQCFLDQLESLIPKKEYIRGIYGCFSNNSDYSYEEQKDIILKLLDIAQENLITFYIGLDNCDLLLWQEIFDEYDLSEIDFIYSDIIDDDETLQFVKENNMTILIRPDVNFAKYVEYIKKHDKYVIGSGFERNFEKDSFNKAGNSIILTKILQNMQNIDKNLLETLINCQ